MENMNVFFWVFVPIFAIGVLFLLLVSWRISYCLIFKHKNWVMWEGLIKNKDNIVLAERNAYKNNPELNNYTFISEMGGEKVEVIYWEKAGNRVSVHRHDGPECILSSFDTYHVKKMRKVLEKKIEAFEAGKQLITEVARDYLLD